MMDQGLLMRRVMAQLELTGHGATMSYDEFSRAESSGLVGSPDVLKDAEGKIVWASIYWFRTQWWRARSWQRKSALLRIALDVLRTTRIRVKAKHDLGTLEGRLAVGREALTQGVDKVAIHYGYSVKHVYDLARQARWFDDRERQERERERYDGTLEMRLRIAMTPGTVRDVAEQFGVSKSAVAKWRSSTDPMFREAA